MKLKIYFENEQNTVNIHYALKMLIRETVLETLAYEGMENDTEVSFTFVDDKGIKELNNKFRKKDAPTDVLSFPLFDYDGTSEEPPVDEMMEMLGDVVLSLEHAAAQAEEFGHSFEREVAFLTVHSMLHLLGYDHETGDEDEADMRARQRDIMEMLGLSVATEESAQ